MTALQRFIRSMPEHTSPGTNVAPLQAEWLSPKEYAHRTKVCAKTVYRAIKAGQLAARRIGRQLRIEWTPVDISR